MPENGDTDKESEHKETLKRIISIKRYREGVIAEFFYVGAQIMCWTFIIQYGTDTHEGISEQAAEITSQQYNILAMVIFFAAADSSVPIF